MDDAAAVTVQDGGARGDLIVRAYRFARRQAGAHKVFVKFMISGGIGYLLYQATIFAMYEVLNFDLGISTIVAAEASITGGFFVRDMWVFTDGPVVQRSIWRRFIQYQAKSLVSTLLIVSGTVYLLTSEVDITHFVSVPIGVALGFVWNWGWERGVIWRKQSVDRPPTA